MAGQGQLFGEDGGARRFVRQRDFFAGAGKGEKKGKGSKQEKTESVAGVAGEEKESREVIGEQPLRGEGVYSVTEVARLIRGALRGALPERLVVRGELSGWKKSRSGHVYPVLKDAHSALQAVMWRSDVERLKFRPEDGLEVVATGRVDYFPESGRLQFYIDALEPAGVGALELAFRQMAEKLRAEGLFAAEHKKALPRYPMVIGIVTSGTGAAAADIGRVLGARWPMARKLLVPVAVQGSAAAGEIARAIGWFNKQRKRLGVEVLIVGRGGGSIEDLWAFNEEEVARAIFASAIPVISGVGHEVDTTIADWVADARAATPTAAAQMAVPDVAEVREGLAGLERRLGQELRGRVVGAHQGLETLAAGLGRAWGERRHEAMRRLEHGREVLGRIEPGRALQAARERVMEMGHRLLSAGKAAVEERERQVERLGYRLGGATPARRATQMMETLVGLQGRLGRGAQQTRRRAGDRVGSLAGRLKGLDPRAVLRRGYSITRRAGGELVREGVEVKAGEMLWTELADEVFMQSQVVQPPRRGRRHEQDEQGQG